MEVQVKVLIPIVVVLALLLIAVIFILCCFFLRPYCQKKRKESKVKYTKLRDGTTARATDKEYTSVPIVRSTNLPTPTINKVEQSSKIGDFKLPHVSNTFRFPSPQDKRSGHFDFVLGKSRQDRSLTEIHSDQGALLTPDDVFHFNDNRTTSSSSPGSEVGVTLCKDFDMSITGSQFDLVDPDPRFENMLRDEQLSNNNSRLTRGHLTNDHKTRFRSEPILSARDDNGDDRYMSQYSLSQHKRRRFSSKLTKLKKRTLSLMSPAEGQVEFTLYYEPAEKSLIVNLIQLIDINLKPECFVGILEVYDKDLKAHKKKTSVHLIRDKDSTIKLSDTADTVFLLYLSLLPKQNFTRHTSIVFGTQSAVFNEKFSIPGILLQENMPDSSLCIHALCKFGRDGEPIVLGEVKVPLKRLQNSQLLPFMANLTAPSEEIVLENYLKAATDLGYLEIYLSFNLIAQSLVVKIIQATGLPKMGMTGNPNISVKTSLYYCNSRIEKKTTTIQKRRRNPIFNETFEFQLSKDRISECDVLFEIRHHGPMYRSVIGYVIVGNSAGGEGTEQWRQLLDFMYHEKLYKIMPKKPIGLT